jgi:hypothetical protein
MSTPDFEKIKEALESQSEAADDCCGNCVWFQGKDMTCHRLPPYPVVFPLGVPRDGFPSSGLQFVWPRVNRDDWCGEFESGDD